MTGQLTRWPAVPVGLTVTPKQTHSRS